MSNYALEIDFKKVKGYKKLSFKGKQLLHKTYDKHNRIIGIENKVNWRPKHVKELCDCQKCEKATACPYKDKYQRLPRENAPGALGLCLKL